MEKRLWILGAPDPEMEAIEGLLRQVGERIIYALGPDGARVRPADAYRVAALSEPIPAGATVYRVECDGPVIPTDAVVIDHHRPGDPGYGRPPAEFLSASSIGQVIADLAIMRRWREETPEGNVYFPCEIPIERAGWRTLPGGSHHDHYSSWYLKEIGGYTKYPHGDESGEAFVAEMVEEGGYYHVPHIGWVFVASRGGHELGGCVDAIVIPDRFVLAAAADHCLAAAYRGECPGVDPDALMRWRIETRAAFQGRTVEEVLADVEAARRALRAAQELELAPGITARDMRERVAPELPEAAAREGVAYVAAIPMDGGKTKIVLGAASPAQVRAFMGSWAQAVGLEDIYGDPERGFAGGFLLV